MIDTRFRSSRLCCLQSFSYSRAMDKERRMRCMLVELSHILEANDLVAMKFLCKDFIPLKKREELTNSLAFFSELEQRGKLKYDDLLFLEFLLEKACGGRTDVLEILSKYKTNHLQPSVNEPDSEIDLNHHQILCNSEELASAFVFLETNLGGEYLMVLRRLGVYDSILDRLRDENPHNVKEIIHKGLNSWHLSKCNGACLVSLTNALKKEKRKDLAVKIETGNFT